MTVQAALDRKTMNGWGMWTFGSAASAPMVVLAGGLVATYAATGVVGVPLAFLLIGCVVALLSVGYLAMARRVPHAAVHYAILGRGLGRDAGVVGGMVALLAYNAIQISLYGLLGATMVGTVGGSWWVWAYIGVALVGALGVRAVTLSTRLLGTILVLSLLVVALFDLAAIGHPADGFVTFDGFAPANLFVTGVGGTLALCLAAFVGFEAPASFSEEARSSALVTRAVFAAAGFLGALYAVTAWAMGIAVGPQEVADVARDPEAGLPFSVLETQYGALMASLSQAILCAAIVTSLLAFHSVAARYGFAMAREGVLPAGLATTGRGKRTGAPVGGSLLQSVIAAAVVTGFALAGTDPVLTLFTWLSTLGALGLLALLIMASLTAVVYLGRNREDRDGAWTRVIGPVLGIVLGAAVLIAMLVNVSSLLSAGPDSPLPFVIPGFVAVVAVAGLVWARFLRRSRPDVYAGISRGRPRAHEVPDRQLDDIDV